MSKIKIMDEILANKIAAGLPSSRADKKSVIDYLDEEISDEDYKEWYSRLQRRV